MGTKVAKAVIFGLSGTELSAEEKSFFSKTNPLGFILFKRNIDTPKQVRNLVKELRLLTGRKDTPILIDQEGGRVARLRPPNWRNSPPAILFANLAKRNLKKAKRATYINTLLIASELSDLGINVDCAPVADIFYRDAHDIIGDRAFGDNPEIVSILAGEVCRGFMESGITPIIKHIPGHGRANLDSHKALPVVRTSKKELIKSDFLVFKNLSDSPWAMTAHIKFSAIDNKDPTTLSKKMITIIREEIGFKGVLLTDDLSMKALKGNLESLCKRSLAAGCDIILHCNGKMHEMKKIAKSTPELSKITIKRLEVSKKKIKNKIKEFNVSVLEDELASLLNNQIKKTYSA